jgi:hypothetical protein
LSVARLRLAGMDAAMALIAGSRMVASKFRFPQAVGGGQLMHGYPFGCVMVAGACRKAVVDVVCQLHPLDLREISPEVDSIPHTQPLITVVFLIIGLWSGASSALVLGLFLLFSFLNAMNGTLTSIYPGEVSPPRSVVSAPVSPPPLAGSGPVWAPSCCR